MIVKTRGNSELSGKAHPSLYYCLLWIIAFLSVFHPKLTRAARMEDLEILDQMLMNGYDRRATPTNHLNNTPTRVACELFVRSFGSPNPLTMDYKVDLYLRQKWKDERLQHRNLKEPLDLNDPNLVKAIWKPEVYFPNAKEADFQFVTVPNVLVRIYPNGQILYMLRLKVTFSCMMDLSKFPLDTQTCTMEVASFSKTMDELILEWSVESPVTTGSLGMSQFEIDAIHADNCRASFGQIGNYSCLVAEFHLSRSIGFHLVQSYLPTILMVFISWVSFWMDVNSVPGRVTLGVTTLLTVSTKSTTYVGVPLALDIQENLPQASYVKAIDIWMGTCTAFVFLALLEFIVVNYLWRKEYHRIVQSMKTSPTYYTEEAEQEEGQDYAANKHEADEHDHDHATCTTSTSIENNIKSRFQRSVSHDIHGMMTGAESPTIFHTSASSSAGMKSAGSDVSGHNYRQKEDASGAHDNIPARVIDETCRYAFPLAFALFNCIYWPYYIYYP